jgi:hypothetical protein
MKTWRELSPWRRVAILLTCLPLLDLLTCEIVAPHTWSWTENNLQVRIHNDANLRAGRGSAGCSGGWSKFSLACDDWSRDAIGGTWGRGVAATHDEDHFRIASVSPAGVSVRVRYRDNASGTEIEFDRVIFVPAHRTGRLDIAPDIYITGEFE